MKYLVWLSLCWLLVAPASASGLYKGYLKYGFNYLDFPEDSIIAQRNQGQQTYQRFSARLMGEKDWNNVTFAAHYDIQYTFAHQPTLTASQDSDSPNLLDMTSYIVDEKSQNLLHKLDRLYVHYKGEQLSVKAGRQALTWGHGLMFQVMDIFNPFSPLTLDTDYKSGSDMLLSEYLLARGDDLQLLYVPRRDNADNLAVDASAFASKYHGFFFDTDVDLLIARNFSTELVGLGIARPIMESMWRFDVIANHLDDDSMGYTLVSNLDYSWVWLGRNVYGFVEYMFDSEGGKSQGGLSLQNKHYGAVSLRIELHPLVNISPSIITNLEDNSSLFYLTIFYDWMQDFTLSSSVIQPFGSDTSEFAGEYTPGTSFQLLLSAYF